MNKTKDCFINKKTLMEKSGSIFNLLAGLASIFGLIYVLFKIPEQSIVEIYIIMLSTILIVYVIYINTKELHRYSQVLSHIHAVNHIIRDALVELENIPINDLTKETKSRTKDLVNIISSCYSMLSRTHCNVSLKEVQSKNDINYLNTIARDSTSFTQRDKHNSASSDDTIDSNTDFSKIWYKDELGLKYYLSNNLKAEFKKNNYKNTSFLKYGDPELIHIFGYPFIKKWTLPYMSTLVFPIQYMNSSGAKNAIYGFLCIDSNSTNIFDSRYMVELGAAFADALYLYFSQVEEILDRATRPQP